MEDGREPKNGRVDRKDKAHRQSGAVAEMRDSERQSEHREIAEGTAHGRRSGNGLDERGGPRDDRGHDPDDSNAAEQRRPERPGRQALLVDHRHSAEQQSRHGEIEHDLTQALASGGADETCTRADKTERDQAEDRKDGSEDGGHAKARHSRAGCGGWKPDSAKIPCHPVPCVIAQEMVAARSLSLASISLTRSVMMRFMS